jgi:hypothetical protein
VTFENVCYALQETAEIAQVLHAYVPKAERPGIAKHVTDMARVLLSKERVLLERFEELDGAGGGSKGEEAGRGQAREAL